MGDTTTDEDVQINFLASRTQRERWEEFANDEGFRSLSEFLRVTAERLVNDNGAESAAPAGELGQQVSEIVDGINRLDSRLQDLDSRLQSVEREVRVHSLKS